MKDYSHNYKEGRGPEKGHGSNPMKLPDERNPGQKDHRSIPQDYAPAAGSPVPTQAPVNAKGIKGSNH